jgi:putative tryptophan/tyrosine transport system substrate-binding protein
VEISLFPLDESGFPSAVNNTFLSFRICDKKAARMKCAMKRAAASSILVSVMLLAVAVVADAQQPTRVPRIGFLSSLSASTISARAEAFRQGLRGHGYVEGKTIFIEWRYAEGELDSLPALAAELVRLKVDVIVTGGPAVNRTAKEATGTIPIVLAFDNDPVGNGFAASLARPGGNITDCPPIIPR